jgi:ATP-dependent protease ClpP protease subunit
MPNWKEVLDELKKDASNNPLDTIRRKYLKKVHEATGRNVIAYYSGWLQKTDTADVAINDKDKNAFMVNINNMDRSCGLDLILHTPGGDVAATESIVSYLRSMFGNDIRAIVPQISMSAGTMIAMSCKSIMMGKQSSLGPIDPQIGGVPCQAVIKEFEQALKDVSQNASSALIWQTIIGKYHPTFLSACQNAIKWSEELAKEFLSNNMCNDNDVVDSEKVNKIISLFSSHEETKSHSRHISRKQCLSVGLTIEEMEENNYLQDVILTTHHAFMHSFTQSHAVKIVENHLGVAYIESLQN